MSQAKTAIVIGAGFGGLALAIRLQSAGIQTTLFEKRAKPGGRAYVYEEAGFTFDAGPTVITDPAAIGELWAISGRDMSDYVTLLPVDPFYQLCWEDGYRFDYGGHRFLTRWPELRERVEKLLNDDWLLVDRHSLIVSEGRRLGYPLELGNLVRTVPWPQ